jgi:imidazole glycerol-phosphate synthase subunit HisH
MIGIIDYGLGNLTSVAGAVAKLGHEPVITGEVSALLNSEKLILPGVGAFGDGMRNLNERGLTGPLGRIVKDGKPILGICLGAQLMTASSTEFGQHEGLGWVPGEVRRITSEAAPVRIPHVGWNEIERDAPCVLFDGVDQDALFYFVHSYCIQAFDPAIVRARCRYGESFVAAFQAGNVYGTQFHPEKSQRQGLAVLRNFLDKA